jgi:hypothetical protein
VSAEIPVEKKHAVLVEICRASHFAWREAALRCCPNVDPRKLVNEMWDITGVQTGEAYLKRLDPSEPLPAQIAASIAWSSQCMGEDARAEDGDHPGESFVRHVSCPWHRWHAKLGLLAEDRPGCDRWLEATLRTINRKLGVDLRFETMSALPDGGDCCLRRIWQDDRDPASGGSDPKR